MDTLLTQASIIISIFTLLIMLFVLRYLAKYRMLFSVAKRGLTILGQQGQEGRRSVDEHNRALAIHEKAMKNVVKNIPFADQIQKLTGLSEREIFEYATDPVLGPKLVSLVKTAANMMDGLGKWIEQGSEQLSGLGKPKKPDYPLLGGK